MLVFQNKGLIVEAGITVMGLSAKVGDNPIGQFGTGLNNAISIVLRNGGAISIFRGLKELKFGLKKETVRKQDFDIITMNGRKMGWSSNLGLNWKPWMAYRELYSNTKDEGGTIRQFGPGDDTGRKLPCAGHTTIIVEWPELDVIHENRHEVILTSEAAYVMPCIEAHLGDSPSLYYRGIRVMEWHDKKRSKFTYNLRNKQYLTEDRTLLYPILVSTELTTGIVQSTNLTFLRGVLSSKATKGYIENSLNYDRVRDVTPSPQFMEAAEELRIAKDLVGSASTVYNHYQDSTPGYRSPYIHEPTPVEEELIEEALAMVRKVMPDRITRAEILFKSTTVTIGRVSVSDDHLITSASLLKEGKHKLARVLIEGIALRVGGHSTDQLAQFILSGSFIPKELQDTFSKRADNYDPIF